MSALQATRAVLAALAAPATFHRGVFMARRADGGLPPPPPRKDFRGAYAVVFVDASGWLNMAAHMSGSALAQARPPPLPPGRACGPALQRCLRQPGCLLGRPASCRRASSLLQHRFELARGEETGRAPDARRRGAQAQAAAARSVALLDRPRAPLDAFRAVFLARQPRGAAFDAWWHVHVPAPGGPALGGDVPAWRCAPDTPPGEARSGRRRLQDLAQAAAARNAARACRVRAARRL
jgi:hypothetical protein